MKYFSCNIILIPDHVRAVSLKLILHVEWLRLILYIIKLVNVVTEIILSYFRD